MNKQHFKPLKEEQLKKEIAAVFAANPEYSEVFATEDGSCFTDEKEVTEWAKRVERHNVRTFKRSDFKEGIADALAAGDKAAAEEPKKEKKGK